MSIQIINPLNNPDWDSLVLTNANYSFFHSSSWASVLSRSYGYEPLYFCQTDDDGISAFIPVMEVDSRLTGKRGVSLPFTDYCSPLASSQDVFQEIIDYLINYGKKAKWKYFELREGGEFFQESIVPFVSYATHTLDLSSNNEKEILSGFRSSNKRNIKKAGKQGVDVKIFNSLESVNEFYQLNCITRKDHGLPPQPYKFFKKVYEHIISMDKGFIALASYKEKYIAGAVYIYIGEKCIYKYGASDRKYQNLRANNLVMWEAIRYCIQKQMKSFCFGRTETENKGLMQFKHGWGTIEQTIKYYRYDFKKECFVEKIKGSSGIEERIFNKMPIFLLRIIGSLLYKHVG